jgi:hypothetical protein
VTTVAVIAHAGKTMGGGLEELRQVLDQHDIPSPLWYEVPKSKEAPKRVEQALDEGADLVFVWGGDGMVQRSIGVLAGTGKTLAIVPAGTANLLATNLGIPCDIGEAVDVGLYGEELALDVGSLNGERFAVMAGAESRLVRRRRLRLADLINERWVLPPSDSIPGTNIAQAFRANGLDTNGLEPPRAHMVSFSLPLHHHLLATGDFVTMLPTSMLRFGKHLPLKLLPVEIFGNPYPTGIITLKHRTLSPLAQLFIGCAREVATAMAKGAIVRV